MKRVVIVSKSSEVSDQIVAQAIEQRLQSQGHVVFRDLDAESNMLWAKSVMDQIHQADLLVPLLSKAAASSEHLAYQIETAHDTAQKHSGKPAIIPCLIQWVGPIPEPLGGRVPDATNEGARPIPTPFLAPQQLIVESPYTTHTDSPRMTKSSALLTLHTAFGVPKTSSSGALSPQSSVPSPTPCTPAKPPPPQQ